MSDTTPIPTPRLEQFTRCVAAGYENIRVTSWAARDLLAEYAALDTARAHLVAQAAIAERRAAVVADAVVTLCAAIDRVAPQLDWITAAALLEAVTLARHHLGATT